MSDETEPPPADSENDPEEYPEPPGEEPFTGECVPQAWDNRIDPADHGTPISFSLRGSNIRIDAKDTATVQAIEGPGTLAVGGNDTPLVAFEDAIIDGTLAGTLVVVGSAIALGDGRIDVDAETTTAVQGLAYALLPTSIDDDGSRPELPVDGPLEHAAALADTFRFDTPVTDLQLLGYDSAYVVTENGERVDLTGPVIVSAARLYAGWSTGASGTVTAQWSGTVVIGLDPEGGEISGASGALPGLPTVMLAIDPTLRVDADTIATAAETRTRVAMDEQGALLPSSVEIRLCESEEIVMVAGDKRVLRLAYRQDGPATDAVFSSLFIDVDDQPAAWQGRVNASPSLPSQLVETAERNADTGWGQGLADFVRAWGEATRAIGEGITCVFTLGFICPDHDQSEPPPPDPLVPYPAWMSPGAYGTFDLELNAPRQPGTYEVQLHIAGDNYDAIAPVRVVVY